MWINLQCRRPGFDPWVWKIPWRREWLPTPVFWPGESGMYFSPGGHKQSDMTKRLSLHLTGCHKNAPKVFLFLFFTRRMVGEDDGYNIQVLTTIWLPLSFFPQPQEAKVNISSHLIQCSSSSFSRNIWYHSSQKHKDSSAPRMLVQEFSKLVWLNSTEWNQL